MDKMKWIKQTLLALLIFYSGFATHAAFFKTEPVVIENSTGNNTAVDTGLLSESMIALINDAYGSIEKAEDMAYIVGEEMPAFKLTSMTGEQLDFEDFKGKKLIIELVANWCGYCKNASKETIDGALEANPDYEFIQVFVEGNAEEVKEFYEEIDRADANLSNVVPASQDTIDIALTGFPTSVFVNEEGKIVWVHAGALDAHIATFVNEFVMNNPNLALRK